MEETKKEEKIKFKYPNMSKEDLSKLARDIATNKVFCSSMMKEYEMNLLGSVFMPLLFGAMADYPKEMVEDIGFIYEYYSEAGPRSINGLPMFMSCRFVSKADVKRLDEKIRIIRKALDSV